MKKTSGSIPRSLATVITAALVAALFAGGSAFAIKALTKKQANKIYIKKSDADSKFVRTGSASSASGAGGVDLAPNYVDVVSTQININGGKVLATANVSLRDTNGASVNQVECFLKVDGADIDHWTATVQDTTGSRRPVYPLVGATGELAKGNHTVLVRCGEAGATTGVILDSAHLIAWNG